MSGSREKKKPTPIYCEESSNDFRLENSFANFVLFDNLAKSQMMMNLRNNNNQVLFLLVQK